MKELSIEQKAKAYDKALEKARQLCAYPTTKPFISDLQDLFPELKESDDERIINRIKKAVEEYWSDEPLDEILAWLENQGEQKPAWSEEDEKLVKNLISTLSNLYARNLIEKETKEKYTNLLKSLKDRPQPKQEWSMYDETILKTLIDHFEYKKEFNEAEDYDIVLWLKSLRPQSRWKPSDEQMVALDGICSYIRNKAEWEISQDMISDLYKLSEQLKKLREE